MYLICDNHYEECSLKVLVTGSAGFIGSAVVESLISKGAYVIGIDNLNDYYDVSLKQSRLNRITNPNFIFLQGDISDSNFVNKVVQDGIDVVVHLAAQAGVRYSIENPMAYADSNLVGHLNILEACRTNNVKHLVYASSSSVYGLNDKVPFSTNDSVDHPVSLYAATKKANELMSHAYSHLYGIPTTGLRFFTVYGPWGRPDMAPFIFTKKILNGQEIDVNNNGDMWRDFTYIDDIVEGITRVIDVIPTNSPGWSVEDGTPASSSAPYAVYNIGNGTPVNLMAFISEIESTLGIKAKMNFREMQLGDVYKTYADVDDLFLATGYKPKTSVSEGVKKLVTWYLGHYN